MRTTKPHLKNKLSQKTKPCLSHSPNDNVLNAGNIHGWKNADPSMENIKARAQISVRNDCSFKKGGYLDNQSGYYCLGSFILQGWVGRDPQAVRGQSIWIMCNSQGFTRL